MKDLSYSGIMMDMYQANLACHFIEISIFLKIGKRKIPPSYSGILQKKCKVFGVLQEFNEF